MSVLRNFPRLAHFALARLAILFQRERARYLGTFLVARTNSDSLSEAARFRLCNAVARLALLR
jgi:hypothetical protein